VFSTICGLSVIGTVAVARRMAVEPRIALAAVGVILAAALATSATGTTDSDPTFRFAISGANDAVTRMIADVPWLGNGAGTYASVLPIYAGIDDAFDAPTAAFVLAVELGRPMSIVVLA